MKVFRLLFSLAAVLVVLSCASVSLPIDRGVINPGNLPEEELAVLIINKDISVLEYNNEEVEWLNINNGRREQIVKIPPGFSFFHVKHSDGVSFTNLPVILSAYLEGANTYFLTWDKFIPPSNSGIVLIRYHIYQFSDSDMEKDVLIRL